MRQTTRPNQQYSDPEHPPRPAPRRPRLILPLVSIGILIVFSLLLRGTFILGAAEHGNAFQVRLLLKMGAEVNATGWYIPWDRTPLMLAASNGSLPTVRALIAHGADVNADVEEWSVSPLMCAAEGGDPAVVRLLIAHGAKLDNIDGSNDTALTIARANHYLAVVKILKAAGAKELPKSAF